MLYIHNGGRKNEAPTKSRSLCNTGWSTYEKSRSLSTSGAISTHA